MPDVPVLPVNLDAHIQRVPPLGYWRVLDLEHWSAKTGRMVGDFDDFGKAMDSLRQARHPFHRVVVNDLGVDVAEFSPGSFGVPKASAES